MTTHLFHTIVKYLNDRGFHYDVFEHTPVFTSDVASQVSNHAPEEGTKSLTLQGRNKIVVVTVASNERVDFRQVAVLLGEKKLSMAKPDTLSEQLGTEIGGLAPFGYNPSIPLAVSETLSSVPSVYFNPGRNDMTISVSGDSFRRIMQDHDAIVIPTGRE